MLLNIIVTLTLPKNDWNPVINCLTENSSCFLESHKIFCIFKDFGSFFLGSTASSATIFFAAMLWNMPPNRRYIENLTYLSYMIFLSTSGIYQSLSHYGSLRRRVRLPYKQKAFIIYDNDFTLKNMVTIRDWLGSGVG